MISWTDIVKKETITIAFAEEFQNKMNWDLISEHMNMDEDFMLHYQDKLDWEKILVRLEPSVKVIEQVKDKIDWNFISSRESSLSFIEKYSDYIDFSVLFLYHTDLSVEFIIKHYEKIEWNFIHEMTANGIISRQWVEKYIQFLDIDKLKQNDIFSLYTEEQWTLLEMLKQARI